MLETVATTAGLYLFGCFVAQLFFRDWVQFAASVTHIVVFAALLYWVIA